MAKNWDVNDLKKPHMRQQAQRQIDEMIERKARQRTGGLPATEGVQWGDENGDLRRLKPPHTVTIWQKVPSRNTMDAMHWTRRRKFKAAFWNELREMGLTGMTPVSLPLEIHFVRILGKYEKLYDEDNFVGGLKQLIDAIVTAGWIHDDSPKYLSIRTSQDRSQRAIGPAVEIRIYYRNEEAQE